MVVGKVIGEKRPSGRTAANLEQNTELAPGTVVIVSDGVGYSEIETSEFLV